MSINASYVAQLLEIAERTGHHSGKLSSLQSWAIGELIRISDECKADAVAKAEKAAAEEAQAAADAKPKAIPSDSMLDLSGKPTAAGEAATAVDRRM